MGVKMKRGNLSDERFKILIHKLIQTQTTQESAYHINKIFKEINRLGNEYSKAFNEFKEKYGQKNEDGTFALGRNDEGLEVPDSWVPQENLKADLDKAMKELNEEEVTVKYRPLTPAALKDMKISAYELELLGELYSPENGPGVPLHAV